jgi:putative molybdopterin biosynthesis protein
LDAQLEKLGVNPQKIAGYTSEKSTHTEVAQSIAEGIANTGIGLEGSAMNYGLDFIFLTLEQYDLVTTETVFNQPVMQMLLEWLNVGENQKALLDLGGYAVSGMGKINWVGG